ncbi:MAG TPA: 4'-phosphopantetheinyl transferase superfamily protein [Solirubrobacterales bacterium]
MLERILPPGVAVVATREDIVDQSLFAEEERALGQAVAKRRREFTTARACARAALDQLGEPPRAIPVGSRGAPAWPGGIVGSITHCDGYRACAVARSADIATIGVDAEPNAPLPAELLGDIAFPREQAQLAALALEEPGVSWDRLLFSAKESVYKAWFPLAEAWLGFEDAALSIDRSAGTFSARLLVRGPKLAGREITGFSGRWLVRDRLVLTAIAVPARALVRPARL